MNSRHLFISSPVEYIPLIEASNQTVILAMNYFALKMQAGNHALAASAATPFPSSAISTNDNDNVTMIVLNYVDMKGYAPAFVMNYFNCKIFFPQMFETCQKNLNLSRI